MAINLPVTAVGSPHDVVAPYMGPNRLSPLGAGHEPVSQNIKVLTFYSGMLIFDFPRQSSDTLTTEDVFSFIPYSDGLVQAFGTHPNMRVAATVTASLASFSTPRNFLGAPNTIAAVDEMGAKIVPLRPNEPAGRHVLVLKVRIAARNSFIHRVSYSVTVNVSIFDPNAQENPDALTDLDAIQPFTRTTNRFPPVSLLAPSW
ncbi:hypothetical protein [Streptomyces liliifuscus]|uniref:Uncharacterized protein n=1 Tax=Streptomyces liliifuscus TaxID=2797636 RepID=A0A7T7HZ52_9ACTN|nr:hypothetical protein [Streptomyces liliifuscus]QQM38050.1 hypothetical protein JEQ17_00020 [Streptomyces liliifuscus]QQM46392.1 hypothetical protein JEQ17_48035 [Streptomyces liliifuscus]